MTEPTDKDRLDWLDRNATVQYRIGADFVPYSRFHGLQWPLGKLREAIDSAMAAERSGAPGAFGEGVG